MKARGLILASSIAVCASSTALAGPVERELKSRAGNVVTPSSRPDERTKAVPKDVLPDDLGGGPGRGETSIDPAEQSDVTLPTERNADASPQIQRNRKPSQNSEDKRQSKPMTDTTRVESKSEDKEAETPEVANSKPRPQRKLDAQCVPTLAKYSNAAAVASPTGKFDECRIQQPVALSQVSGLAPVELASSATLDCSFATAFADYIRFNAQPLAQIHLKTELTKITAGPGFQCRRRNNLATGKLSEHAFGNGIDILSFTFADGTTINVSDPAGMEEQEAAYFNAVRKGACEYFTTVLGPGSNAAHANHLHVDLGRSIGNPNPYRICE